MVNYFDISFILSFFFSAKKTVKNSSKKALLLSSFSLTFNKVLIRYDLMIYCFQFDYMQHRLTSIDKRVSLFPIEFYSPQCVILDFINYDTDYILCLIEST